MITKDSLFGANKYANLKRHSEEPEFFSATKDLASRLMEEILRHCGAGKERPAPSFLRMTKPALFPRTRGWSEGLIFTVFLAGVEHGVQILRSGVVQDGTGGEDITTIPSHVVD